MGWTLSTHMYRHQECFQAFLPYHLLIDFEYGAVNSSLRLAMACSREGGSLWTSFFGTPPWPDAAASASRASRSARRFLADVKSGAGRLKKTQG